MDFVSGGHDLVRQRRAVVLTAGDGDSVPRGTLPRDPADDGNVAGRQNFDFDPRVGSVACPCDHAGDCLGRRFPVRKAFRDQNPGPDVERQAATVAKHWSGAHVVPGGVSLNAGLWRTRDRAGPSGRKLEGRGFDYCFPGSGYGAAGGRKHLSRNSLSSY